MSEPAVIEVTVDNGPSIIAVVVDNSPSVIQVAIPGAQGPKGDTGDQGIQGPQGDKGDTGDQGPTGPAGGVNSFTELDDAPDSFTGQSLKVVRVNSGETALEFATPVSAAADVSFTPAGNIASTDVQAALEELDTEKQAALGFTPVPDTRTVAGHALSADVTLSASDVSLGNVTNDVQIKADFSGYTGKTTPVDADTAVINDSAASGAVKSVTWANIKATLKAYFDTLYQPLLATLTSWGAITRASGFDTFAATPSSANLRSLLTDEVGTGAAYFVGGALGTPASGTLSGCSGLPVGSVVGDTSTALGVGTVELGHASDTTLARAAAGRVTVEGVELLRPAAQSDQETSTSNILGVTPGVQQFHPSAAKVWAYATVSAGVPSLAASYNVTSITDTATGRLTITIATDFSSTNYCSDVSVEDATTGVRNVKISSGTIAAGSIEVHCVNNAATLTDPVSWHFAAYGDQ